MIRTGVAEEEEKKKKSIVLTLNPESKNLLNSIKTLTEWLTAETHLREPLVKPGESSKGHPNRDIRKAQREDSGPVSYSLDL